MKAVRRTRRKIGSFRERIALEIKAHKRGELDIQGGPYLNNFHCHLPGGLYRLITEWTDVNQTYDDPRASLKRRKMTRAQFSGVIDALISELGLDAGFDGLNQLDLPSRAAGNGSGLKAGQALAGEAMTPEFDREDVRVRIPEHGRDPVRLRQ